MRKTASKPLLVLHLSIRKSSTDPTILLSNYLCSPQLGFSVIQHDHHAEISPVWDLDMEMHECCDKEETGKELGGSTWTPAYGVSL